LPSAHQYISGLCPLLASIFEVKAIIGHILWLAEGFYCLMRLYIILHIKCKEPDLSRYINNHTKQLMATLGAQNHSYNNKTIFYKTFNDINPTVHTLQKYCKLTLFAQTDVFQKCSTTSPLSVPINMTKGLNSNHVV
jgi:hypothetical protein